MDLEDTITAEEILASRRISRQKTLVSLSAGVLAGAAAAYFHHEDHQLSQPYFSLIHGFLTSGLFTTLLYLPLNSFSPRGLAVALQAIKLSFRQLQRGNLEEKIAKTTPAMLRFLEDAQSLARDPLLKRKLQVSLDITRNDYDLGLRHAVSLLRVYQKANPLIRLWHSLHDVGMSVSSTIANFNKRPQFVFGRGLEMLARGMPHTAEKHFSRACDIVDLLRIPMNCFYAYVLDFLTQQNPRMYEKRQQQWKKTVDLLLEDPDYLQQFRRLGTSRHEVLEIGSEGLLHDTFIFKRDNPSEHLTREYLLDQTLYTFFDDKEAVAQPLTCFIHKDKQYLVLRRIPGNVLLKSDLAQFMPFLYQVHTLLKKQQEKFPPGLLIARQYAPYLEQRYGQRVPSEQQKSRVLTALYRLAEQLDQQPKNVIHGDLHPDNVLSRTTSFTILDLEHLCLATRNLDLAALLEHDKFCLTESEQTEALHAYYQQDQGCISFEECYRDYQYGALFRALQVRGVLESHSYGSDLSEQKKLQEYYTQRAQRALAALQSLDRHSAAPLEDILLV